MSAASREGGASRPSPFRRLFASLRQRPETVPPPAPPPSSGGAAPTPRLLANPAGKPRQASLLEPTGGGYQARIVAMQDFIGRLRRQMARLNISRNDPLAPLIELMGEMLLHFTHLLEDLSRELTGHAERSLAELDVAVERARGLFAESLRSVEGVMTRLAERNESAVARIGSERRAADEHLSGEAKALLIRTVIHHNRQQIWIERVMVGVIIVILTGAAYIIGQNSGCDRMQVAVQATESRLNAAILRDGPAIAMKWINLIEWNRLAKEPGSCAPQPSGNSYRLACTYTLWNGPPDETPP